VRGVLLEYRRVVGPVQLTVLTLALVSLAVSVGLVLPGMNDALRRPRVVAAVVGLGSIALFVVLLPASLLPSFQPALVGAVVGVAAIALTAMAVVVGRGDPPLAVVVVTGVGAAFLVLDAALGWPTLRTPLMGGGVPEGVRFYGLGNTQAGILLAGTVLGAARLPAGVGVSLLATAGMFAGLPFLGADLGGGLTMFVAAALWYGLRVRERLGWREWALAAAAPVAGLGILVAAHQVLPPDTHVTEALQGSDGPLDLARVFADRLASNVRITSAVPVLWLTVAGLPAWLAVAVRRPGSFRWLERDRAWRDAVVVLAVGGMIGYVLNDTYGMASIAFVFLSAAMLYPTLMERWTSG
jgi:hypothetical protein